MHFDSASNSGTAIAKVILRISIGQKAATRAPQEVTR